MKQLFIYFAITMLCSGCFRLDDNLFNSAEIAEYKLDEYLGEVDFKLPPSFDIPDDKVHIFKITGFFQGNKHEIYSILIGDSTYLDSDTLILYFHGRRDHMDFYWPRAELLANVGGPLHYSVLMFELPGYGLDKNESSEQLLYEYSAVVLEWLEEKGMTSDRLIFYGFSLGSAPATKAAAIHDDMLGEYLKPSALILEAPFASAEVLVQDATIINVPAIYFTDLEINNAEIIKDVAAPFLWFHGTDDMFLNIETNGELVFKNYTGPVKEAIRVPGADHGSVPQTYGFDIYLYKIWNFLHP